MKNCFFLRQFCKAGTRLDFEGEPWGKTITLDWAFPPLHIVHSAQSTSQSTSHPTIHSTAHPILCNAQSTHNQIHNPLHICTINCTIEQPTARHFTFALSRTDPVKVEFGSSWNALYKLSLSTLSNTSNWNTSPLKYLKLKYLPSQIPPSQIPKYLSRYLSSEL